MAVGMFASSPVGTGIGHLVMEVAMMTWDVAPSGSMGGAEEMRGLAVGGDVVEPGTVGATATLFILILSEGIILCVLTRPGNGAPHPAPQT
jgi:hypothetical protein